MRTAVENANTAANFLSIEGLWKRMQPPAGRAERRQAALLALHDMSGVQTALGAQCCEIGRQAHRVHEGSRCNAAHESRCEGGAVGI